MFVTRVVRKPLRGARIDAEKLDAQTRRRAAVNRAREWGAGIPIHQALFSPVRLCV